MRIDRETGEKPIPAVRPPRRHEASAHGAFSDRRTPATRARRRRDRRRAVSDGWLPSRGPSISSRRCAGWRSSAPLRGSGIIAADDAVRFWQEPSLAFAPATLSAFQPADGTAPPRISVRILRTLRPAGPLPLHVTEYVRERECTAACNDRTRRPFLRPLQSPDDRAVLSRLGDQSADRSASSAASPIRSSPRRRPSDRFAIYVASLVGSGMPALRNRDACPDLAKLHYSGRLRNQAKNAEGLAAHRRRFPRCAGELNSSSDNGSSSRRKAVAGSAEPRDRRAGRDGDRRQQIWDCQQEFRIRMGPMTISAVSAVSSRADRAFGELSAVVRNYVGDELAVDGQAGPQGRRGAARRSSACSDSWAGPPGWQPSRLRRTSKIWNCGRRRRDAARIPRQCHEYTK